MKKIIFAIFVLIPFTALAENMCVKDGSTMVVLDPTISGTTLSNNATGKTWSTQFSYGVISGIGACSEENMGAGAIATNQNNLDPSSTGHMCFCKMLRPVESVWVQSAAGYNNYCYLYCAGNCSSGVAGSVAMRIGMFSNIKQD